MNSVRRWLGFVLIDIAQRVWPWWCYAGGVGGRCIDLRLYVHPSEYYADLENRRVHCPLHLDDPSFETSKLYTTPRRRWAP